jgi:hypothetical protein
MANYWCFNLVRGYRGSVRGCVEVGDYVPYERHISELFW